MIPEIDIWRSAQEMIRQHREDTAHQADAYASALTEQGDSAGSAVLPPDLPPNSAGLVDTERDSAGNPLAEIIDFKDIEV